jgi:hypothetical protein
MSFVVKCLSSLNLADDRISKSTLCWVLSRFTLYVESDFEVLKLTLRNNFVTKKSMKLMKKQPFFFLKNWGDFY